MFSPLRNRFGIPGVIAVIALVFAMLGGAYAANNSGNGSKLADASKRNAKKKKAKAKRGPRGPKGAKGDTGAAGPAGPVGPAGPQGPAGANGKDGTGTKGDPGESVELTTLDLGQCDNGEAGVELSVGEDSAEVCDGLEGPEGPTGPTGQTGFTATLPPGETETGTFAINWQAATAKAFYFAEISLPIPLPAELGETDVHAVSEGGKELDLSTFQYVDASTCQGSVDNPIAPAGQLCVYVGHAEGVGGLGPISSLVTPLVQKPIALGLGANFGAGRSGAVLAFVADSGASGGAVGSWAVRAPAPPSS